MANKYKYQTKFQIYFNKYFLLAIIVVMLGITIYFANYMINRAQTLMVGATTGNAQLFFEPSSFVLPPNALVNVWVTTDKPLAFARTEFTFDPNVLKLTQEISLPNPSLKRVVRVSTMSEANSTGKVIIIIGIDPALLGTAPTGSFKIAGLNLAPKVTTANLATTIAMVTSSLQLVDTGATAFNLTSTPANLTLNPVVSPSPTPSASPISSDTVLPTVSLTYPGSDAILPLNTSVILTAQASDNVGVSRVRFFVGDALKCTVTAPPYTCEWNTGRTAKTYRIRVKAFDFADNENINSINISTK